MVQPAVFLTPPAHAARWPDPSAVERLSALFFPRVFRRGESIVPAGGRGGYAVLLVSGTARETDGLGREFGPGELLDSGGVSEDGARAVAVVAATDVCARIITRVGIERLRSLHPREWAQLLPVLVAHVRQGGEG
jgi:CRP-like cAMP-binding protein